jgi:hypothetical protein
MKGFGVMNPQNSSKDEVLLNRGDDSRTEFEGEEIRQEVNLAQGLAWKRNHQIGNYHKEVARLRIGA